MNLKSKIGLVAGCIINASVMLVASIFLLNQPVVHDDEKILIEQTAEQKAKYLGEDEKPNPDDFLFINISYDKELIPVKNELMDFGLDDFDELDDWDDEETENLDDWDEDETEGLDDWDDEGGTEDLDDWDEEEGTVASEEEDPYEIEFPFGSQIITNRAVLAKFFSILNTAPENHTYVICDVIFEDPSKNDIILKKELEKLPNVIVPLWVNAEDETQYPLFDVNAGLATYTAVDNYFVKYRLSEDSLKTIPLVMYEQLHGGELKRKNAFFYEMGDKSVFNNFILNLRIHNEDVADQEGIYRDSYWKHLSTVLTMNTEEDILEMTKGKIIVIGDFEDKDNDYHQTVFGEMAGPLILLNAYLALVAKDNVIHSGLYIILFVGFFIISLQVFHPKNVFDMLYEKVNARIEKATAIIEKPNSLWARGLKLVSNQFEFIGNINGSVKALFTYMGMFTAVSVAAYLLLNNHINIFYLSLYVVALEKAISYIRGLLKTRN